MPGQSASSLYTAGSSDRLDLFNEINSATNMGGRPNNYYYVPLSNSYSLTDKDEAIGLLRKINTGPNSLSPYQAGIQSREFDVLSVLSRRKNEISFVGSEIGALSSYLEIRTNLITSDLKKLDAIYKNALQQRIPLNSDKFRMMKADVQMSLQKQINGFSRGHILSDAKASKFKTQFGISHKSISHKFKTGNPGYNTAISKGIERSGKFAKKIKAAGNIGFLFSGVTITSAYQQDGVGGAVKATAREGAKFGGARLGSAAAVSVAILFGVSTGGTGFIVLGLAAVVGGFAGDAAGSAVFDVADDQITEWIAKPQ